MSEKVNEFLNIPKTLEVGFRGGYDTFTGKLAYVTYLKNGKIAKEVSWTGWRDKKIDPLEVENEPTTGFIINKKVGGEKSGWNFRRPYCRIYDPRGFEFEITFDNLIYILQEHEYSPSRGLQGKYVYAWDKTDLVLLPTDSEDYTASKELQEKAKAEGIGAKDLVPGIAYKTKNYEIAYYLGKFDWKLKEHGSDCKEHIRFSKYHSFLVRACDTSFPTEDMVVGINSMSNILITRTDIPKLTNPELNSYIGKFKVSKAGNTALATELKLEEAPDSVKQLWEDSVVNKKFPPIYTSIMGAIQESDKKIAVYELKVTIDSRYDWITKSTKTKGDPYLELTSRYDIMIDDDGAVNREYYPISKNKVEQKLLDTLVPISEGSYARDRSWKVKVGNLWYEGGGYELNGVYGRSPEIKIE